MKWINRLFGSQDKGSKKPAGAAGEPTTAKEHCQLGWSYHEKNKLDEAAEEYRKALEIDPDFALARSNLGMVYKIQGKMDDAIREWEETLNRGATSVVRMNAEDWLKEAKGLREVQLKPVVEIESEMKAYLDEMG